MPRESIITILRSLSADTPTGLTFGEFGFAGASRKLFVGGTGGGATVESVWIGASITGESLNNIGNGGVGTDLWENGQDANNTLSTSKAIRNYVDSAVGTKGDVNSVNDDIGIITITGAGNNAAVSVRSTVEGTHLIDVRIATNTGITGVASFSSASFNVGTTGVVTLKNPSTSFGVQGNSGGKADVTLGRTLTLTGSGSIRTVATQFGGDGDVNVVFDNRIATTTGITGVASFDSSSFAVSLTGHTTIKPNGISNAQLDNSLISIKGNDGLDDIRLGSTLQLTGTGAIRTTVTSFGAGNGNAEVAFDARIATASLTGVASFDPRHFALGASGHVSLTGPYQATGHTVVSVGSSQVADTVGNTTRIDNKLATINGQTGVASFSSNFQISSVGKVDLANDVTIAGNLTVQGDVVTANVSNFTVKDTLIKLGTGNNTTTNIYDLGFYMQYPQAANNIRLAGFFLDYEDTKFKLFTGLTAGAQDGSTGTDQAARLNTDRQGYTVATLIARLDGGTF